MSRSHEITLNTQGAVEDTEYVYAAFGFDEAGYAVVTVKKYSHFARLFGFVPVTEFGMAL